jgi:tetratricopeptide (TPR) repeat protein
VAANEDVTLRLVKEAVEWFLGDERLQFDEFVKVDCGTLLHLISTESEMQRLRRFLADAEGRPIPIFTESEMRIELVHETLRTFLTDAEVCPIPIPLRDAHDHILSICLDILSSERDDSSEEDKALKSYASKNWVEHLSKASVTSLGLVRTFLESDSFKRWIFSKGFAMHMDLATARIDYEQEANVNKIYRAIRALIVADKSNPVDTNLSWVQDNKMIYLYAGKAWTEIWAHGASSSHLRPSKLHPSKAFLFVLRSYCCRSHDFDPKSIAHNTFSVLLGDPPRYPLRKANLGIVCVILQEWDKSVEYLSSLSSRDEDETAEILGLAYIRTGEYNKAIEKLKYISHFSVMACIYLGLAYWANRNVPGAIEAFEEAWNQEKTAKTLVRLSCLYCSQESVNKIDIYKSGVVWFKRSWWAWQLLGAAYLKEGNFGNAIEIYSRALAENPDAEWARDGSHEAQRIKNMQANLAGKLSTIAD